MRKNITVDTDIYKLSHWKGLHPAVDGMYSYGEPRIGSKYEYLCWFGLQMIIEDHFLQKVTEELIKEGERRAKMRIGFDDMFNREAWERVKTLGYLPIEIKSAPEGSIIHTNNVMFTFEATEKWFAKTSQLLESTLMHVWYPTEISSRAYHIKKGIKPIFEQTCDNLNTLPFAVNDFGYRGATCHEAAARGGAGFLIHFLGSDNEPAMTAIEDYYGVEERLLSVWATEHSVALSFGPNHELDYVKHQLTESHPAQTVSIVIDAYDQDNFIQNVACHPEIVEMVKARPGRVVWRPDTGIPLTNMCRYSDVLGATYGFEINTKGYKVLKNNVGLIQGDGMNEHSIVELYRDYVKTGWAADNIVTGSGGGLLQVDASRDSNRWAIKPSYMEKNGVGENVFKMPKSDPSKASKSGKLKLHFDSTIQSSKHTDAQFNGYMDQLNTVYRNGVFHKDNFKNIVDRANKF